MLKNIAIAFVIGAVVGGIIAIKYQKPTVLTVEKEIVRDKVITKILEKTASDGSKIKETNTVEFKVTKKDTTVQKATPAKKYNFYALVSTERNYALGLGYRVLGPLSIIGTINTEKQLYLGISYAF